MKANNKRRKKKKKSVLNTVKNIFFSRKFLFKEMPRLINYEIYYISK